MKSFKEYIKESINDKFLLKAVFLAGAPGSGKSFIAELSFKGLPVKMISSDVAFEHLLQKNQLSLKVDTNQPEYKVLRGKAVSISKKQFKATINGLLPFVWDGTGRSADFISEQSKYLRKIGYDTSMVFVNTSLKTALRRNKARDRSLPKDLVIDTWYKLQKNLKKFYKIFGRENVAVVDNDKTLSPDELTKFETKLQKAAIAYFSKPVNNFRGQRLIRRLHHTGGKYISDINPDLLHKWKVVS